MHQSLFGECLSAIPASLCILLSNSYTLVSKVSLGGGLTQGNSRMSLYWGHHSSPLTTLRIYSSVTIEAENSGR